jgi:hypothetical protein
VALIQLTPEQDRRLREGGSQAYEEIALGYGYDPARCAFVIEDDAGRSWMWLRRERR